MHGRESGLDEAGVRGLTDRASPSQPARGRSRTVVSFTQVVDRAQLGDAYRGKVEAEMVRIVHRVQQGAGKTDRGSGLKDGSNTHMGWGSAKIRRRHLRAGVINSFSSATYAHRGSVQQRFIRNAARLTLPARPFRSILAALRIERSSL